MGDGHIEAVSDLLWRERRLLEQLAYRLEAQRLMLVAGKTRYLVQAAHEVGESLEEIRQCERERSEVVEIASIVLEMSASPTLQELVQASPEPWASLLDDHRDVLSSLRTEIDILTRSVSSLTEFDLERLEAGRIRLEERISSTEDRRRREGTGSRVEDIEMHFREVACQAALAGTDRIFQKTLSEFLA